MNKVEIVNLNATQADVIQERFAAARLCVVGNINRDIKTAPFAATESLLRDGETPVHEIFETVGGGGAISACAAAALGASVAFVGKIGDDAAGERLQRAMIHRGVKPFLRRGQEATGASLALNYAHGERHFLSWQPNNATLRFEDLDLQGLIGATHLLRADIWFSEPMLFGGNAKLFQEARHRGIEISLDLNWDPQWGSGSEMRIRERKEAVRAVLPWVTLAHGNVRELNAFADAPDLQTSLERITGWGAEAVVVHLGPAGAGYYANGTLRTEPAAPIERCVNQAGSGDVLSVCMMLLHGSAWPISERLQVANRIVANFMRGELDLIPPL
ncbi:MAG: PfkB family carbohydrate kinase [Verrucomicrobiota bacterium]